MVWSVVVAKLPQIGFAFTTDQLFWLAALPGLSGATLRIFYSFMVPIFGGRLWTTLTTWSLMIPRSASAMPCRTRDTPYWILLGLALLCGFGGGNFASSMSNIGFFFPKAEKGNALALNAGLGNLGVSVDAVRGAAGHHRRRVRLVSAAIPRSCRSGEKLWLQNAGFIWVPFIISRLSRPGSA
jgi:NNP family nitrate/nitrite transporter-like MFS transporter